jgi:hypothetical protein
VPATDHIATHAALCRSAELRFLPAPDTLDHAWDPTELCVILDDGAESGAALAGELRERGWRVSTIALDLQFPESWPEALRAIAGSSRIAAFVDIHAHQSGSGDLLGQVEEEARVKASFLLARALQPMLTMAHARAWYTVVTRVDGKLGLDTAAKSGGIVTAGVAALAKTLRHEWPAVACRAIDLDPAIPPAVAARLIAGELLDPDRSIAEVGHGPSGRCIIGAFEVMSRV